MRIFNPILFAVAISGLLILGGCSTGNCRSQKEAQAKEQAPQAQVEMKSEAPISERVQVYKYDGSLQCGMGKAVSVTDMQKDLKEIKVYASVNKTDGLMRIQQCGTPTGTANVYEIEKKDLEAAKKLGFKLWTYG